MGESKKVKIEFDQVTMWKAGTIIFAVLFIISIFTGGFSGSGAGSDSMAVQPSAPSPNQPQQPTVRAEVDLKGEPTTGDKNAQITIVEFTDYQCPFCNRAYEQTYPEIKKLIEKGDVKYVVKDYPLPFHNEADEASIAANCAGEQGKYWEMHDKLFETQSLWSGNSDIVTVLTGYATGLGLDEDDFTKCMADPAQRKEVEGDVTEGAGAGVSGTPSFLINGQLLVGAQPWSAFKTIIDAELSS